MEPKLSESVADWLRYIKNSKEENLNWLSPHEENLLSVLRHGLNWEPEFLQAYELLTMVCPYFVLSLVHVDKWFPLLMDALVAAQDIKYRNLQLKAFRWLGEIYLKLGKPSAAWDRFSAVLERAELSEINDLKVVVYIGLFKLQWFDLTEDVTQTLVNQALEIARQIDDQALQADLYDALAPIYARKMDTAIALGYGQTAFVYWMSVNNHSGIGRTAYNVATIYVHMSHFEDDNRFLDNAMAYLELARETLARTDDVWQHPLLAYEQAIIYFQRGDNRSAADWFQQSLSEAERMNSPQYIVVAQHGLGLALSKLGQYPLARRYLGFAFNRWEELNNSYEKANIFVGLADLELSADNKQLAKVHVKEGLHYAEDILNPNMREFMKKQFQDILKRLDL